MAAVDVAQQRMVSQHVARPVRSGPADVVHHLGAMQSQDYTQALWAVGSRLARATTTDVTDAIAAGSILRTWPMRGTIHFVAAADAHWMLRVSTPRTIARHESRMAELQLDEGTLASCHQLLRRELSDGAVSRPRIMESLESAGVRTTGQRGYTILWHAAQTGLICIGPTAGKQQTFVLLDQWVPPPVRVDVEHPVVELARRYFVSHGPATTHDFAWWAAITVTEARTAVAALSAELRAMRVDDVDYWTRPGRAPAEVPGAHLLAGFDETLLGYQDRSASLPPAYANRIVPGGNGVFQPTMVRDGRVVGTWRRKLTAKAVAVELVPFEDLAASAVDFESAATRFAQFVELPLARVTVAAVAS